MRRSICFVVAAGLALCCLLALAPAHADEGMWTFDNPPVKQLQERYGFTPSQEWLDHVRLASVRFNDGGSGSFVSPNGLVLTNHHVARGQLQKVSSSKKNYVMDGFIAHNQAEELKCPDLELNVLFSMEDVTKKVIGAATPDMSEEEALKARKAEMAKIEKESLDATGLRSDVVSLYHGGEYWLYRYKKYTDIRLVFAPEGQAAFFGGDPDNFTFPRYDLDMALFRVYEDGKPITSPSWLPIDPKGADAGELVFVSGHPGSTDRLYTMAQLEMARDHSYPYRLAFFDRWLKVVQTYAAKGPEQARQADMLVFGLLNAKNAMTGEYEGLQNPRIWKKRQQEETEFRQLVEAKPELKAKYAEAWDQVAKAEQKLISRYTEITNRRLPGFRMPRMAQGLVRYVTEVPKPDGERLDGYHDAQLDSLRFRLLSPAPVYPALDEALVTSDLETALENLGPDDPFVKAALGGKTPAEVAHELMANTRIGDPAFRKQLLEGGAKAVENCKDPLVAWAWKLEPMLREVHDWMEDNVESVTTPATEKIGQARFAVYGKSAYPDATFTLRLSYGTVKGYPMNGTQAPPFTTFYGLYDRAHSFGLKAPWNLLPRFAKRQDQIDLSTRLDFVSTCDIIGGNSGSPVVDREGHLVGLIFDGNIESLVGRFVYDEESNRAVAVHSAAILTALEKLYDGVGYLAAEMQGQAPSK